MNSTQRYYMQIRSIYNTDNSILSKGLSAESAIDRYCIHLIETRDNRRLLLDKDKYKNIIESFAEDACNCIEKGIGNLFK